jgi:hypothetical protein
LVAPRDPGLGASLWSVRRARGCPARHALSHVGLRTLFSQLGCLLHVTPHVSSVSARCAHGCLRTPRQAPYPALADVSMLCDLCSVTIPVARSTCSATLYVLRHGRRATPRSTCSATLFVLRYAPCSALPRSASDVGLLTLFSQRPGSPSHQAGLLTQLSRMFSALRALPRSASDVGHAVLTSSRWAPRAASSKLPTPGQRSQPANVEGSVAGGQCGVLVGIFGLLKNSRAVFRLELLNLCLPSLRQFNRSTLKTPHVGTP